MANLTETPTYPDGIYRIETTDPIIGGENGIANVQAKQLAGRTAWLKERADQVDAAKGEETSLPARMDAIQAMAEAVGPEMQSAIVGLTQFALDQAGQANAAASYIRYIGSQRGTLLIKNRGVISGCAVTRSTTASRNLNISAGRCFASGKSWPVAQADNTASVPSNTGGAAITVTAYLRPEGYYNYSLSVTAEGEQVPPDGIEVYEIVVPSGNTDGTDPGLSGITLTDIRRIEPEFPAILDGIAGEYVPLAVLPDRYYHLSLYAVDINSGFRLASESVMADIAPNGFVVRLLSAADNIGVFWQAFNLDGKELPWPGCA